MVVFACSSLPKNKPLAEFRGVWVATVVNIDWPKNGLDSAQKQKDDFLKILDFYDALNFNALIVQVRTAGDAFYPSQLAPWSRFLSGQEGKPKAGFEDALSWMIQQTHNRGMQFHAWLNPYRATFDLDTTILDAGHDYNRHPEWMVKYGKKYYYNPGIPAVWEHLSQITAELVLNYPIDGIHFDDYFYPYTIANTQFKDSLTYTKNAQPDQSLTDWRRANVDSLVKNVYHSIKKHKPWVQFGISPFGVWKNKNTDPKGSDTRAGQTTFDNLYADPLLWMQKGWVDYMVPQAYWSMHYPAASHNTIAHWWAKNSNNTQLYMGNGPYKIKNNADQAWHKKKEIPKQLQLARSIPQIKGNVFFSAKSLLPHPKVTAYIKKKLYRDPALIPTNPKSPKRQLTPAVVTNLQQTNNNWKICLSHYDSVPRYIGIYKKGKTTTSPGKLLKKAYLPANAASSCVRVNTTQNKLVLKITDAFGNHGPAYVISKKELKASNN